ncbi:RNA splicing factor [Lithospermum erythrorhizon]|uniref:RNA splicing factor n=1 Tax=Lithospermum erythrorhizon TaxID=34254 RepID=A0AAV3P7T1_LITER
MGRNNLESPERDRRSPHRRSPSRRDGSPARHRTSHREKLSREENITSRKRSPKRARSRSPESHSPAREKITSRARSPKYRREASPRKQSPIRAKPTSRARSPKPRESISPVSQLPEIKRPYCRAISPKGAKSESPERGSPSPRTKRLKRVQDERKSEMMSERAVDKSHGRRDERDTNREKDSDREFPREGKERRSRRDEVDNGSSRSRSRRSISPSDHHRHNGRRRSMSPAENRSRDEARNSRRDEDLDEDDDSVARMKAAEEALQAKEKHKPSFELSGKLAAETNRVRGVTLLFTEPPEARKPSIRWRLYVFKGGDVLNEPLYIHRQTCYLFGRERRVADVPTDHPSCSKQHAVLQYRQVEKENPDGTSFKQVSPYLMDLGSTNGTYINDNRMEPQRYYELFERDTIKFGNSSREYVLLHENSA